MASKINLSSLVVWPLHVSILRQWFCCCLFMFVVAPIICVGLVLGILFCSAVHCVISSFVINLLGRRESWLLYFWCVLNVMSLLSLFVL